MPANLTFDSNDYALQDGETVLECLLRHGVPVSHGCRSGHCMSCAMRCTNGAAPDAISQRGLRDSDVASGLFLACQCEPTSDMTVARPDDIVAPQQARVAGLKLLSSSVLRFILEVEDTTGLRAGQFVQLIRPDGLIRPYSIANSPAIDNFIELHVRRIKGGRMSTWMFDHATVGTSLQVAGPYGSCVYDASDRNHDLLMISTGTGLAPIWGILQEAQAAKHEGAIHVYHAARSQSGLYLVNELQQRAAQEKNIRYTPVVCDGEPPRGGVIGEISEVIAEAFPNPAGHRVFLCGAPAFVDKLARQVFLAGVSRADISYDRFVMDKPRSAVAS